ncbi:ubiquitin-protein ligase peroxin 12 [Tulasnella sp. 419]|nr:ubiquitin-protein ligase peroxin 12 [Tulasnella sp. 419]
MDFLNDGRGSDPYRPSLFELVAQEQLRESLQPALKYVLGVFAQSYPRYLLRIVNRHEEFYALLMFFVERHNLRQYGASFAENFYGLKRRRKPVIEAERAKAAVGSAVQQEKLRGRELRTSLLFLVGIPYIRAKAHDYYEQLGGGVDPEALEEASQFERNTSRTSITDRLRYLFKIIYPYANTAFELWMLAYNVAYLFDRSSYYRPWLAWMKVDIRRMGPEDYRAQLPVPSTSSEPKPPTSIIASLRRLLASSPKLLLDSLKVLLPLSIFFIKFLEWWYHPSSPARSLAAANTPRGPPIPPPKMLKPHSRGILGIGHESNLRYGECPICRKGVVNATALPSGWVFCYKCVFTEVEEKGKCPVTLLPMKTWQLRKVLI